MCAEQQRSAENTGIQKIMEFFRSLGKGDDSRHKMAPISDPTLSRHLRIAGEQLGPGFQTAYLRLEDGILEHKDAIKLGMDYDCSNDDVTDLYHAVLMDNPLLFFVGMEYSYSRSRGATIYPRYRFSEKVAQSRFHEMIQIAERIKDRATDDIIENELLINDYLVRNTRYINFQEEENQFMDSALIDRISVCMGISAAASFLFNYIGIPCGIVQGHLKNGPHAWNIVSINGKRYHIDITNNTDLRGNPVYRYFNMSDSQIRGTHSFDWKTGCDDPSLMYRSDNY